MFKVCAPIFETITIEKETSRVRTIKRGEKVQSMWDHVQANARAFQFSSRNKSSQGLKEGFDQTFVYTEADEIEDSILFPEEGTGEMKDNVFRANHSLLEMFEKKPTIDLRRFARDLDSDEELSENDSLNDSEDEEAVDDDGDEAWETETDEEDKESEGDFSYSFANTEDVETAMEILEDRFRSQTIYTKGKPPVVGRATSTSSRNAGRPMLTSC